MTSWASAAGKWAFAPLEIGLRTNIFSKTCSQHLIPINFFTSCNDSFPIWPAHCTRARFTLVLSWIDELVVHSCLLPDLQMHAAKLASGLLLVLIA